MPIWRTFPNRLENIHDPEGRTVRPHQRRDRLDRVAVFVSEPTSPPRTKLCTIDGRLAAGRSPVSNSENEKGESMTQFERINMHMQML